MIAACHPSGHSSEKNLLIVVYEKKPNLIILACIVQEYYNTYNIAENKSKKTWRQLSSFLSSSQEVLLQLR